MTNQVYVVLKRSHYKTDFFDEVVGVFIKEENALKYAEWREKINMSDETFFVEIHKIADFEE